MPSNLDPELARGMEKLTRASWPVKAIKRPSALARACVQRDALQEAVNATNESFLERAKVKLGLGAPTPSLDKQLELAQQHVKDLEEDVIDGFMVPLTESDKWSVQAQFLVIEILLKGQMLKQPGDSPEVKAVNEAMDKALDITGNMVYSEKWVGAALKKKTDKGFEPYWPFNAKGEVVVPLDVEKSVIERLWVAYHQAFVPTEAELKKLSAPTTQKPS